MRVKSIVLHVTTVCGHNCPFCYFTEKNMTRRHANYDTLKRIVDTVSEAGAKEITFVGGDPATHPNIVDLGKYAHEHGLETTILSNTLYFHERWKSEVIDAFDTLETTVHSRFPNAHDEFCKCNGAYQNVITNLKSFATENTSLGIVYNLTPKSYSFLFDTVKHIIEVEEIPIDHIVLQRIAAVGRADEKDDWNLSNADIDMLFLQIEQIEETFKIEIHLEDTFPYCLVPKKYQDKYYIQPCSWGYESCSLDLDGNISLCCTDPNYTIGNILEVPFQDIWDNAPQLLNKRAGLYVPERCGQCEAYKKCGGGCVLSSITNHCQGDILLINAKENALV
jgi:radical SAM protein with 4Fe4S-binding SPASM domain